MRSLAKLLLLATAFLTALSSLSCTNRKDEPPSKTQLETMRKAIAEYDLRMNQERFDEIWESITGLKGEKEAYSNYLRGIHQKYGAVLNSAPIRAITKPARDDDRDIYIECWSETQAERGHYVDNFTWHLVGDQLLLVNHQLLEYDPKGNLYMTLTLKNGLGPNDYQVSKITLATPKRNVE
ncbi:MAG TPA: hypothetical protein VJT71_00525 [Pyrinomonadaceae bacterium]|nr:hypothetical protein [Pyrinomonadaceae bacterium]